ncbi:hypothetical protein LQ948_09720 [Jiella sp. MQZ9-1]|uniref:Uncharacterized protein n=1 Tax=Jiella flava TaxID=2816857 RepID=A0A939JX73_9HYPH|nr:hypothetical protein [Jiella flava]MCD2471485.1 hypothetical protein [Jiella flava]
MTWFSFRGAGFDPVPRIDEAGPGRKQRMGERLGAASAWPGAKRPDPDGAILTTGALFWRNAGDLSSDMANFQQLLIESLRVA